MKVVLLLGLLLLVLPISAVSLKDKVSSRESGRNSLGIHKDSFIQAFLAAERQSTFSSDQDDLSFIQTRSSQLDFDEASPNNTTTS